jgi:hypothetical protein
MDIPDSSRRSLLKMAAAALSSSISLVGATNSATALEISSPKVNVHVPPPPVIVKQPTTVGQPKIIVQTPKWLPGGRKN